MDPDLLKLYLNTTFNQNQPQISKRADYVFPYDFGTQFEAKTPVLSDSPDISPGILANRYLVDTNPEMFFPSNRTAGLRSIDLSDLNNMGVANEEDEEQVEYLTEPTGIKKLLQYLPFGDKSLLRRGFEGISNLIPRRDPRAMAMQNFYGSRFGLTDTGSVASGIMAGYNPVSGFGQNKNIGLARAMQKRIERIQETLNKKNSAQLENRLKNLRNLQRQEMQDRFDRGESLSDIGKSTFTGKGMAFEKGAGKVR